MNKKCLFLSIASILSLNAMNIETKCNVTKADETILVGEAKTYDEKIDVATRELSLNIDEKHVVANLNLVYKGLYNAEISYSSSDEEVLTIDNNSKQGIVHRASEDKSVVLTATLVLRDNKENVYTRTKEFELVVLNKKTGSVISSSTIEEDFTTYETDSELSEYLKWNLASGDGGAKIIESVPNNDMIPNNKALMIPSKRTAQTNSYVTEFNLTGKIVFEGYFMFTGEINGIYFEVGNESGYGPSFGIKNGSYTYYKNGEKIVEESVAKPTEGVWTKFRIEADTTDVTAKRKYIVKIYNMDGTNNVTTITEGANGILYNTIGVNRIRIRAAGGSKVGAVYVSNLVLKSESDMPINEGYNPNRKDGIGKIIGYQDSVLYINGEEKDFESGFSIYNRFDETQKYEEGKDYSLTKEVVSSSDKVDVNKYVIKLSKTNEIKELIQTVYKEDLNALPEITDFKVSHLSRKVVDETTGDLSTTGSINVSGKVSRKDGTIYYAVQKKGEEAPTSEEIVTGTKASFVKAGNLKQEDREVQFSIDELSLENEYDVYVIIKNATGSSSIYSKTNISEIINITTCEEFYDMTVNIDTYKNEFRLMNDLDFSSFAWECNPDGGLKFQGTLNGNGHTIRNLSIQSPYRKAAVFFEITNATIRDLNFVDSNISGLQDSAVLCGYSNGGRIENVSFKNSTVRYNGEPGGEGYFAIVAGRLHKGTTVMKNISIDGARIDSNKYTGVLTGNVNKENQCVLNATNIYADARIRCDGAAIGLVGRNRGTTNIDNAVVFLTVDFAKKEMGTIAGHNKEGGILNAKNVIGTLNVSDCTQPTYFNYFIGSQDDNTSKYTYENVYFIKADYSSISDSINPTTSTRTCGVLLEPMEEMDAKWYEKYTFIHSFEVDTVWSFNEEKMRPMLDVTKEIDVTADDVNKIINLIKDDFSSDDHYYIYKAQYMYSKLSDTEKAKVNKQKLDASKAKWESIIDEVDSILGGN